MKMLDKQETRIQVAAVTSYSPDKFINYANQQSHPTILLTIGSVMLTLHYFKEEDRNTDIACLDEQIGG